MKKMITAVAALLLSAATFAQSATTQPAGKASVAAQKQAATPDARAKHETDQINTIVALGGAYDKVLAVNKDYVTKKQAIKAAGKEGYTEAQKAEMKSLNDNHKKDLETAMGSDLYAKYIATMKAKRASSTSKAPASK